MLLIKVNWYLEDCVGTVHLELIVVPAQIFHQIFNNALSLNSSPAAFLQGYSLYCSERRDKIFHILVFVTLLYYKQILHVTNKHYSDSDVSLGRSAHH